MVITTKWWNFLFLCMHIVAITTTTTTMTTKMLAKKNPQCFVYSSVCCKYISVIYVNVNDLHRDARMHWTTVLPSIEHFQEIDEIEICAYIFTTTLFFHSDFDSFNAIVIKVFADTRIHKLCTIKKYMNKFDLSKNYYERMKHLQFVQKKWIANWKLLVDWVCFIIWIAI